ncbi:MAG: hypothetical protein ACE5OR_01210 [bacterium]
MYIQLLFVDRPLSPTDLAYIRVFVKTDQELATNLELDSDDPWTVWLNGTCLGEFSGSPETAPLDLASGWNEVVVKLTQTQGAMTATLRFVDDEKEIEKDLIFTALKE